MKNPCWEGYEAYGFKMKDGKRVPNCVPTKKESSNRMPVHLELGSEGNPFQAGKAIVVDAKGHHYSRDPIPIERAKRQMRLLNAVSHGFKPTKK